MRKCKEKECARMIPTGRSITSFACQKLGLCRRHYHERFPRRPRWNLPPLRQGSERLLSCDERREMEKAGFNPWVWSPAFRREMEEYWQAREKGEVNI